MDLKQVQRLLKDDISKHQILMAKLKENPKDEELKKQLKDVQKHIAELGTIQKHLGKSKQKENQKVQVEKELNGQLQETNRKVSKVIKSEVIDHSSPVAQSNHYPTQNGQPSHCDATVTPSGSCMAIVNKVLNDKLTTNFKKQHETKELSKVLANNSVVIPPQPTTTVAQNGTSVKIEQQPLNLTKSGSHSNHLFKSYYPNTPVILPITPISEFTSSKRPTSQTVKFRVPVSGRPVGRSIVLLSTSKLNNDKSTFRLVSPKALRPNLASTPESLKEAFSSTLPPTCHGKPVWLNIKSPPEPSCFIPIGNEANRKPTVQENLKSLKKLSQSIVMTTQQKNYSGNGYPYKAPDTKHLLKVLASRNLKQSPELEVKLPENPKSTPKSARNYAAINNMQSNKHDFLALLQLVPTERAERLRNRRYGRRKVAANPVYSGGIYVSTSAAESAKRLLPSELLGIDDIMPAVKRPRGRPRSSTKRSDITEEASRIIEQAKQCNLTVTSQDTSKLKTKSEKKDGCFKCHKLMGELISCDTCGNFYHLSCTKPPLQTAPVAMWFCMHCKEKFSDPSTAATWPGLQSIVHSYFTFDAQRNETMEREVKRRESLGDEERKLNEQVRTLASSILSKVTKKSKIQDSIQNNADSIQRLQAAVQTLKELSEFAVRH